MKNGQQTTAQAPRRAAFYAGREVVLVYGNDKSVVCYYVGEPRRAFEVSIHRIEIKEVP